MGYCPPKGVRPPQLEGKRTGRPKGSKSHVKFWQHILWGYAHRAENRGYPPSEAARLWWVFASHYPDEVREFLEEFGKI
jgi:hypothetical protein